MPPPICNKVLRIMDGGIQFAKDDGCIQDIECFSNIKRSVAKSQRRFNREIKGAIELCEFS